MTHFHITWKRRPVHIFSVSPRVNSYHLNGFIWPHIRYILYDTHVATVNLWIIQNIQIFIGKLSDKISKQSETDSRQNCDGGNLDCIGCYMGSLDFILAIFDIWWANSQGWQLLYSIYLGFKAHGNYYRLWFVTVKSLHVSRSCINLDNS